MTVPLGRSGTGHTINMILAFSSSSPVCSVALISEEGEVLYSGSRESRQNASGACIALLQACPVPLESISLCCADLGPGSFIGVRVGVTIAKTLAFVYGAKAAGATAFDLIDPEATVVLPSKKNEFFLRRVGEEPVRVDQLPTEPFVGYGAGNAVERVPNAAHFSSLLGRLALIEPEMLLPEYLIEPSISTPKKPFYV